MLRFRAIGLAIVAMVAVVLGLALNTGASVGAISGSITLMITCETTPERFRITNNTDEPIDLGRFTISSLVSPRPGVEPIRLGSVLAPGESKSYERAQPIFLNDNPAEGARLMTPYGDLTVLCSRGTGSLNVTTAQPTATAIPATATATAIPTTAPTTVPTVVPTMTPPPTATPIVTATATTPPPTATRPAATATATMIPTAVPTVAPTATPPAPMPGLPNTGDGGGPGGGIGIGAVFLAALVGMAGLVRMIATKRRA